MPKETIKNAENGSPVILFDGECNLCNKTVNFLQKHDKRRIFSFSSLQSDYCRHLLADSTAKRSPDSVILYENGLIYDRSQAIIRIAEILGGSYYVMAAGLRIVPRRIRDALYDFIANHRYRWFGKSKSCKVPESGVSDRLLL